VLRVLADAEWTPWLPILAWAIEHPEGLILVDTGESSRAGKVGYYPSWHPYYRGCLQVDVRPEQELGPRLSSLGIAPGDVRVAVLTHLHTDHTGGLAHLPGVRTLVARPAYAAATGVTGRLQGYMPQHWPAGFSPEFVTWVAEPVGPFARSAPITASGDVTVVPTPGHTPGHVSVIVRTGGVTHFIAGDASYSEDSMLDALPDGLTLQPRVAAATHQRIRAFAAGEPTVYLPTHDPGAPGRLSASQGR
jgi:glyoxylase-like metal-dependent hydrolase (beta-lactamase superfamily II)